MNTLENVTGNSLYCINSDGAIYKGARLLKPFGNGGYNCYVMASENHC